MHKFPETQHWRELELALQVRPGEYKVMRKDYTEMKVAVTSEKDADDRFTKMEVRFTISREDKDKIPAIAVLLYQLVYANSGRSTRRLFLDAMSEWLRITLGDEAVVAVAV
jgi:signal transduction histidine kinase